MITGLCYKIKQLLFRLRIAGTHKQRAEQNTEVLHVVAGVHIAATVLLKGLMTVFPRASCVVGKYVCGNWSWSLSIYLGILWSITKPQEVDGIRRKGKVHRTTSRDGPDGVQKFSSTLSLTSKLDRGWWSTPRSRTVYRTIFELDISPVQLSVTSATPVLLGV